MGWADCGTDGDGRPIGYAFEATCDHPGCDEKIHRGLAYACGNMHGETEYGCHKYFCEEHLYIVPQEFDSQLCPECFDAISAEIDEFDEDDQGGA